MKKIVSLYPSVHRTGLVKSLCNVESYDGMETWFGCGNKKCTQNMAHKILQW
jgi:hypothetical protein